MTECLIQISISQTEFSLFRDYIYQKSGILLNEQKKSLLRTRLTKRLRELKLDTFYEYYEYIMSNPQEEKKLIHAISTNVTYFFREQHHWEFLISLFQKFDKTKPLKIWSSACSTGEEPYTIAMLLKEYLFSDIKILATDISYEVIKQARDGIYSKETLKHVDKTYLNKYFYKYNDQYCIKDEIKQFIKFRVFNLVCGDYDIFKDIEFDIIFCRNVLIYFDDKTIEIVIKHLLQVLKVGGYLLIGHSENLMHHKQLQHAYHCL